MRREDMCSYLINLRGDGAAYCLNQWARTSQTVWMEIFYVASEKQYVSQMRCWSRKPVERPGGCCPCVDFKSSRKALELEDRRVLFGDRKPPEESSKKRGRS